MADKTRRGMIIKNSNDHSLTIGMTSRKLLIHPGEDTMITAEEVRDPNLRQYLQVRAVSIVRPVTVEEEAALREELASGGKAT